MRRARSNQYSYLYKTYRWKKIREAQLEAYPLCEYCEQDGRITLATVCDHIEPHKGDEVKFYNGPFQSLCKFHHDSTKKKLEVTGVLVGGSVDGVPHDPNHHWNNPKW